MELKDFTPIKGYEQTHLINKKTQEVYSLIKHRTLRGSIQGGYIKYSLKNGDGLVKVRPLHRLMAETFIPNPNNHPVINHIDGNKLNNRVDNLEWCTWSHNNKEAYRLGLRNVSEKTRIQFMRDCHTPEIKAKAIENLKKSKDKSNKRMKEIYGFKIQLSKDGKQYFFDSCTDASLFLNVCSSSVCRAIKRKNNYVKGYKVEQIK